MTHTEAKRCLAKAEKNGFVAYHSGIVMQETETKFGGNTTGSTWGVNIDGDGHDGRLFGCPKIFWSKEQFDEFINRGNE